MRIFSYKVARDFGFAPNPFHGVCTLATCKPKIRKAANVGDLVVACGSVVEGLEGRAVAIMRVTDKMTFQEYWHKSRYEKKRPFFKAGQARAYGDNIYHRTQDGAWIQERSHHTYEDGTLNESNLVTDTSYDGVLISEDFVYWGRDATVIPTALRSFEGDDLYPKARADRSRFSAGLVAATRDWFEAIPDRGQVGRPGAW